MFPSSARAPARGGITAITLGVSSITRDSEGLLSAAERRDFIRDAASSDCGRQVRLQFQPQTALEVRQHGREFIATGDLTGECVLESSTNLIDWKAVATNRTAGAECRIADPEGRGSSDRFYRVQLLPR